MSHLTEVVILIQTLWLSSIKCCNSRSHRKPLTWTSHRPLWSVQKKKKERKRHEANSYSTNLPKYSCQHSWGYFQNQKIHFIMINKTQWDLYRHATMKKIIILLNLSVHCLWNILSFQISGWIPVNTRKEVFIPLQNVLIPVSLFPCTVLVNPLPLRLPESLILHSSSYTLVSVRGTAVVFLQLASPSLVSQDSQLPTGPGGLLYSVRWCGSSLLWRLGVLDCCLEKLVHCSLQPPL